jgi:hypothetical protein
MPTYHLSLSLLIASICLHGCKGSEPSHAAQTSNIIAEYRAETFNNNTAYVSASLHKQGSEYETLFLGTGDKLLAQTNVDSTSLTFELSNFSYIYEGDVNMDSSGIVTVSFLRDFPTETDQHYPSDVNASQIMDSTFVAAPNSWVTIPPAFTITSPADDTQYYSPNDLLTLQWTPADAQSTMRVVAHHIGCDNNIDPQASELTLPQDAGSSTFAIGTILNKYVVNHNIACEIELVLYREQRGTLDANLSGGTFVGAYGQRVRLHYSPTIN